MNKTETAALIMARAAMLNAEVAGMQAYNQHRLSLGQSIAYNEDAFAAVAAGSGCCENDVMTLINQAEEG